MGVIVEFEYEGRTYRVDGAVREWNIHAINAITDRVALNVDLLTGDRIFISWGRVGVIRLVPEAGARPQAQQGRSGPRAESALPAPAVTAAPPAPQPTPQLGHAPQAQAHIEAPPPRQGPSADPGWYPDPLSQGGTFSRRYWDGNGWTDQLED